MLANQSPNENQQDRPMPPGQLPGQGDQTPGQGQQNDDARRQPGQPDDKHNIDQDRRH
jgi:hypothetical protein